MISDFDEIIQPPPVNIIHPKPQNVAQHVTNIISCYWFPVILAILINLA